MDLHSDDTIIKKATGPIKSGHITFNRNIIKHMIIINVSMPIFYLLSA